MSNLRIKNKKLKRELENLKKQTVPHKIVYDRREIVTLGCKHEYDDTLYGYIPEDVIFREAINDLSDELKPYVRVYSYRDYHTGKFVVEAEIDIVCKND